MSSGIAAQFEDLEHEADAARLGLWVFLGTELMLFGPLFLGYVYARIHHPDAFAAASRHTDVLIGTVNTAVLLTSSFTMALASHARKEAPRLAGRLLAVTAALGIVFLVLKGIEYHSEWREHLVPGAGFRFGGASPGPAELFYYLYFGMTGLHALHLIVGVVIAAAMSFALARGARTFARADRIEVTALYWHFVDSVWIFLYPMLYLIGRAT
jgi:cytochrome c oxidase subunit 3